MDCKYRFKARWFIFIKYMCAKAAPGRKWVASDETCSTCKVNELEIEYDCILFDFAVEKKTPDKPEVAVVSYCLRQCRKKESRNTIKGLSNCRCKEYKTLQN